MSRGGGFVGTLSTAARHLAVSALFKHSRQRSKSRQGEEMSN